MLVVLISFTSFSKVYELIGANEFLKAKEELIRYVKENPSSPQIPQAFLYLGRLEEKPSKARSYYMRVVKDFKNSPYADSALLEAAKIDYALGLYQEAIKKLKKFLRDYPGSKLLPEVLYWLSTSFSIVYKIEEYENTKKQLLALYPYSRWSKLLSGEQQKVGSMEEEKFVIQVGAFLKKKNAHNLKEKLKKEGFEVEVSKTTVKEKLFYRVLVGTFSSIEEAKKVLKILENRGYQGRIVQK